MKNLESLKAQYSSCPSSESEREVDGTKFQIKRIFTGDRKLNKLISDLAVDCANRQIIF